MTKQIGNNLKQLRTLKGWTQEYVADYLCISQPTYARIEKGKNNSWLNHVDKLCSLYKISADQLVQGTAFHNTNNQSAYTFKIQQLENRITENEKIIRTLRKEIINQAYPKLLQTKTA
ncbi:MAG TPA: helix-turn-helix transcriptional regulator [Flavobacteriaceae bacterium]|nr:helix-turn-helix transcriptional regulator [Flavobacteriaceae bacterium]